MFKGGLLAAAAVLSLNSLAAAPSYVGTLSSGSYLGTMVAESAGTPSDWSLWRFDAAFFADVSLTVTPDDASTDVVMAVFYGTEADTANYVDLSSGSTFSVLVASADAGYAGAAETISFQNIYGLDSFVLAVADYVDGASSGGLGYQVAAQVPEPQTWALLLGGAAALAGLARRRG